MASRFFLTEDTTAPAVSPTISTSDWLHINTVRRKLLTTADSSTLGTTAYTPDSADDLIAGKAHHRQYISEPLAAQTISSTSTVQAQFQTLEAHANNNLTLTLKVYTVDSGGTFKSALLAIIGKGTEPTTALRNTSFAATALNASGGNVTVADGDRLVVEIGLGGTPTGTSQVQGHNGSIRWGCNASSGDLPIDETQAGTTYRPWVEFSANLLFFKGGALGPDDAEQYADLLTGSLQRLGWVDTASVTAASLQPNITLALGPDVLGSYADALAKEHRTVAGWIDTVTTFVSGVTTISVNLPADNLAGYADTTTVLRTLNVSLSDSLGQYADQAPTVVVGYRVTPDADALVYGDQSPVIRLSLAIASVDSLGLYADTPTISMTGALAVAPVGDSLGLYFDPTPTIRQNLLITSSADLLAAYAETINGFFTLAARPSDDLNLWGDQRNASLGGGALSIGPPSDSLNNWADAPTIGATAAYYVTLSDSLGLYADQPAVVETFSVAPAADSLGLYLDQAPTILRVGVLTASPVDSLAAYADIRNGFFTVAAQLSDALTYADQLTPVVGKLANFVDAISLATDQAQVAAGGQKTASFSDALGSYADSAAASTSLFRIGWADTLTATTASVRIGWNDSITISMQVGTVRSVDLASVRPVPLDNLNLRLGQNYGVPLYLVDENGNYIVDENGNRFLVSGLIDTLQQGDSVAITRTVSGITPKTVSFTDALGSYADALQVMRGIVTLTVALTDALGSYSDSLQLRLVGNLVASSSDALGNYSDSNPVMTTSGEQRVLQFDVLPIYGDSGQIQRIGIRSVSASDALDNYLDAVGLNTSGGLEISVTDALDSYADSIQSQGITSLSVSLSDAPPTVYQDALIINIGILKSASDNLAGYADSPTHSRGLIYSLTDGFANYLDVITTAGSGQLQAALSENLGQYNDTITTFANFKVLLAGDDLRAYTDSLNPLFALNYTINDSVPPIIRLLESLDVRYGLFNELRYGLSDNLNQWADSAIYKRGFFAIRVGGELTDQLLLTGKVIEEQITLDGKVSDRADISGELYIGES